MPMVGQATARVASTAISSITPSSTSAKQPASATARASREDLGRLGIVAAAGAIAAERVDRLRGQADMADHRDAALRQEGDGLRHRLAALQLHRRRAGLLEHPRGAAEGLLRAISS